MSIKPVKMKRCAITGLYICSQEDMTAEHLVSVTEFLDKRVKDPIVRAALRIDSAKQIIANRR